MKTILTLLLVLASMKVMSQSGTIKGTVTTSEGKPAEFVNISLKGTTKGTISNEKGEYNIEKAPVGTYMLVASFVGLVTQRTTIIVKAGETVTANFTLAESDAQLQEVIVQGNVNKFADKETEFVARMPLKNLENPQVYNVVGKELMKEQVVTELTNALRAAPGIVPTSYPSGGIGVISRGFDTSIGARNGLQMGLNRSSTDISNIERIEFIKGPSGTLFGTGIASFGGLVNLVTKRPETNFYGNVGLALGSFGLSRITADINTPVNKEETVMARINAGLHRQNSFSDFGHVNNFSVAPSLLYHVNEKFSVLFDAEIFNSNSSRPTYSIISPKSGITNFRDIPLGYRQSVYENDLDSKTTSEKYFVEAKYQINQNWTSSTNLSYVNQITEYSYQTYNTWISKDSLTRYVGIWGPIKNTVTNAQQNFVGKLGSGSVKHTVLVGISYTNFYNSGLWRSAPDDFDTISVHSVNPLINKEYTNKIMLQPERVGSFGTTKNENISAYASELLTIHDRLYLMLSLRWDRFIQTSGGTWGEAYSQNSLSPKLGLVYQVVKNKVSLFGNYTNGFQNSNPVVQQPDGSILNVKPIYANQWESGIKSELFNGKVNATLSYYDIKIDNALRTDDDQFISQDGKQQSKGVEFEVLANPLTGLNIILGYGYNNNRILKASEYEGNLASGAPENIFNYWLSYKLTQGALKNIGLGAGGNYVSQIYFNDSNSVIIPSYSIVNSTLFYDTKKWRAGFKLNNIGNIEYWNSWGISNPTRNFAFDFTIKF